MASVACRTRVEKADTARHGQTPPDRPLRGGPFNWLANAPVFLENDKMRLGARAMRVAPASERSGTVRLCPVVSVFVVLGAVTVLGACERFHDTVPQTAGTDRVVCVSKQINEFMYAIGAEQHLVAVDLTSIYPPLIKKWPTVGYHRALSAEGIVSMRPTLFLTDGNVGPSAVLDQLKKVGIPIAVMPPGNTLDSAQ